VKFKNLSPPLGQVKDSYLKTASQLGAALPQWKAVK